MCMKKRLSKDRRFMIIHYTFWCNMIPYFYI
nr:MAG TPA: hypothetical protein [Caudoviricetes sp.]